MRGEGRRNYPLLGSSQLIPAPSLYLNECRIHCALTLRVLGAERRERIWKCKINTFSGCNTYTDIQIDAYTMWKEEKGRESASVRASRASPTYYGKPTKRNKPTVYLILYHQFIMEII